MRLYEHEGKTLLEQAGFSVSPKQSLTTLSEFSTDHLKYPLVLKSQVLFGNRFGQGLIQIVHQPEEITTAQQWIAAGLNQASLNPEKVELLVEEYVPFQEELYVAVRYDTRYRLPVLLFSLTGGSGIEEREDGAESSLQTWLLEDLADSVLPDIHPQLPETWIRKLLTVFFEQDLTLLEINPLVFVDGKPMILDCKAELDDTAVFRHPEWENYPPRTLFQREPTNRELAAKKVNAMDHRGVAGAAYFEFDGTIGILASGGGASLLAMDSLLSTSLKPANYTEYSGNPTREKTAALTEVVLSRPGLEGLWVIGGHANFTDIYETLMAVMDGVEKSNLPAGFPIVIRRGGPRQEEGFAAVKERAAALNLDVHLYDSSFPITETVHVLETAVENFRKSRE